MTTAFSFVQYIGYIEKGPCGYCKGKNKTSLGERRSGAEEEAAHELSDDGSSSLGALIAKSVIVQLFEVEPIDRKLSFSYLQERDRIL